MLVKHGNIELANANLENLAIENATLIPEFDPNITDYSVDVYGEIDKLNILAVPQKENAQVSIEGNENLQYGENQIKVIVTAEDGVSSKAYNIMVYKAEENPNNINNENMDQNAENAYNTVDNAIKSNSKIQTILIVVFVIALGALLIIWAVWMKRKKQK